LLSTKIGQPIVNLGVSGNTTQDGINRLSELDNYKPKVVLLLLGGNDKLTQVPKEKTFQNLEIIIQNIQARGAIVLLLGVKGSLIGDNYEADYNNLSKKYHTAYVSDVLSGLFGNAKYMSDTVHPNDLGYKEISDRIYPVIVKLLN
jgi:acyl-CoA thioesterase-1